MAEQDRYGSHFGANPTQKESHLPRAPHPQGSGAEQDRYNNWFGGGKGSAAAKEAVDKLPQTSGAEQDRYNNWFGGAKAPLSASAVSDKLPQTSGAEQDRYGGWFGGNKGSAAAKEISDRVPQTSGAEQDRYNNWFGGDKGSAVAHGISDRMPKTSGAEQDRYEGWFGGDKGSAVAHDISDRLPKTSGAEQDRYEAWFGGDKGSAAARSISERLPQTSGAEQDRYEGWFGHNKGNKDVPPPVERAAAAAAAAAAKVSDRLPRASGAEQDRLGSHFSLPPTTTASSVINATAVGLLRSAVLPSFGFHAGLSAVAYGVSRYADRVEGKDWLWPAAQVASAWWSAVGARATAHDDGLSPARAVSSLTYPQATLLAGVSAWGLRLFYRIASRSLRRGGGDDPRYVEARREKQGMGGDGKGKGKGKFWNKALVTAFLPEAAVQTLIALPFTLAFRAPVESAAASPVLSPDAASLAYSLAIFLFGAGFALEVLADAQLEAHGRSEKADSELNREGMWSIVRHPNYLGDALVHLSFPLLLLGAGVLHPLALLGPAANYAFLRLVGGDRATEASQERRYASAAGSPMKLRQLQEYRREKNSFWPAPREFARNRWAWIVVAAGAGGVLLERGARLAVLR